MSELENMRSASYLLPDPGGEVTRYLIDQIEETEIKINQLIEEFEAASKDGRNSSEDYDLGRGNAFYYCSNQMKSVLSPNSGNETKEENHSYLKCDRACIVTGRCTGACKL